MMRGLITFVAGVLLVTSLGWRIAPAGAGNDLSPPDQIRHTLHGLTGVRVLVQPINPDARRDGLDQTRILAMVEDQLRGAGIRALSKDQCLRTPGSPCLHVRVSAAKGRDDAYAFATRLMLAERVLLGRDPTVEIVATTWDAGGLAIVGRPFLKSAVHQSVQDKVEQFISDFRAANPTPRPAGRPAPGP